MQNKRTELARWLSKAGYETIEPIEFYRAIFPAGELAEYTDRPRAEENNQEWKYNAILLENTHKIRKVMKTNPRTGHKEASEKEIWKNYIVLDDLNRIEEAIKQYGKTESEYYIAPLSYLGRKRTKKNERWIYACIVEVDHPKTETIDGHRRQTGMEQLIHDWTKSSLPYLMPSACVCSGSGLHLIYLLDRPYPIQTEQQKWQWDNFRKRFTQRVWNKYVTKSAIQYENHCQSFRVVGTRTKKNQLVEAFWLSKKRYTIDELFNQVWIDDPIKEKNLKEFIKNQEKHMQAVYAPDDEMKTEKCYMPKLAQTPSDKMIEAKEKWPEWYQRRVVEKQPPKQPGQWACPRGLYDWFLREAKQNAFVGSRYHRVHALAEFAVKCDISFDEFKKDAYDLYMIFKELDSNEPFHYQEFIKARDEYFSAIAHRSTRKWIESSTGVRMKPPAKRNGRSRNEHITRLNRRRKFDHDEYGDEYGGGRPNKQAQIQEWQLANPGSTKADCARETGIDPKTIRKWWQ